jgi:redox-sensitive bicupin YhaK (pirin superfamily)
MTAGSGIIHQEMPKGDDQGKMGGFQLWANLPASRKMMDPKYRDVTRAMIPEVTLEGGARVKIICGSAGGVSGPVHDIVIEPEYLDVSVPPNGGFTHPTPRGHAVFVYVIGGRGFFCEEKKPFTYEVEGENYFDMDQKPFIENRTLVLFEDGDRIMVSTEEEPVRFLYFSGKPIGEPVVWYGPIVMNTREELRIAFEEYSNGTFLKHRKQEA